MFLTDLWMKWNGTDVKGTRQDVFVAPDRVHLNEPVDKMVLGGNQVLCFVPIIPQTTMESAVPYAPRTL